MNDDKNCACQPEVATELDSLRHKFRELAEENIRLRKLMQQDTTEIARFKEQVLALNKKLEKLNAQQNTSNR